MADKLLNAIWRLPCPRDKNITGDIDLVSISEVYLRDWESQNSNLEQTNVSSLSSAAEQVIVDCISLSEWVHYPTQLDS